MAEASFHVPPDVSSASMDELVREFDRVLETRLPQGAMLPTRFEPKEKLLFRFLKSAQLNVEGATNMLLDHLHWRQMHNVDEIALRSPDEVFNNGTKLRDVASLMPIIERGEDNDRRPVLYLIGSKVDARTANRLVGPQRILEYQIWLRERALARLDLYGSGNWRTPPYFTFVVDLKGVRLGQATAEFYSLMKRIMELDQKHYPGRVSTMTIINVPFFFHMIWSAIRTWVGPAAERKIAICYKETEAKRKLLSLIPHSRLPSSLGGAAFPLPSIILERSDELYCNMVHFSRIDMIAPPQCARTASVEIEPSGEDADDGLRRHNEMVGQVVKNSLEAAKAKLERISTPPVETENTKHISRSEKVAYFRARIAARENTKELRDELLNAIAEVERNTIEFERDVLITRARLRRRLQRLNASRTEDLMLPVPSAILPFGVEALREALSAAREELDAHARAVAFARNYIDVEAVEWENKQRALQARLNKVLDENKALTRTVEVALGREVLQQALDRARRETSSHDS